MTSFGEDEEETFSTEKPPTDLPDRDILSVMVLGGPEAGRHFKLSGRGGVIGRSADADIRILDPFISRRHAVIETNGDGDLVIRDLDSRYGVYVEGEQVPSLALEDGSRIQLSAETVIRVRYQDPKEAELVDQLQKAALTDPLTDLPNRRYLMQRLDQEFSFSIRHKSPIAILMVDLDHFKALNDELGHAGGDEALRFIAKTIQATCRREDVVGRYAGDEFVVLVRGYGPESVLLAADRLCRAVSTKPATFGSRSVNLTLSIGVATYEPEHDPETEMMELFVRADSALYSSKCGGRNRVTRWSRAAFPEPPADAPSRIEEQDTLRLPYPPGK